MIIKLKFDQSNAPASFTNAVQKAASMLDAAITNDITVNIEVGYGTFPLGGTVTGGEAEAEPNLSSATSSSYSVVSSALSNGAAPGDPNFAALPGGATVSGYNGATTKPYPQVLVWSAEAKALGFIPPTQSGFDGFAGFATDIPTSDLVGVALHELTHAMGRVPNGLPLDADIPDIFDLFRFKTNSPGQGERLVVDNGSSAPAAYFSVTGPVTSGGTDLADYGQTSDPSDFLNPPDSNLTPNDPFNEFYDNQTTQSLTAVDLTQLDVLGFGAFAVVWSSGASGDFGDAANWSPHVVPNSGTNVEISSSGTYTVSSTQSVTINTLVMAAGVTLDVISGIFTIDNGTDFVTASGTMEVGSGAMLVLDGEFDNGGTIDVLGGTLELSGTIAGAGADDIGSGGTLIVASGGFADPATILSGGTEIVGSGGTDGRARISGGEEDVFGYASGVNLRAAAAHRRAREIAGNLQRGAATDGPAAARAGDGPGAADYVEAGEALILRADGTEIERIGAGAAEPEGVVARGIDGSADGSAKTSEYLAVNPNGRIPAIDDNGFKLWESMAINLYLAKKHGNGLWPRTMEDEAQAIQWSFWAMTEVEKPALAVLLHRFFLPEDQRDPKLADEGEQQLQKPLAVLDQRLATTGYLVGSSFTVADLNVASVLSWARMGRVDLSGFPHVDQWLAGCLKRPAAVKGAARRTSWSSVKNGVVQADLS